MPILFSLLSGILFGAGLTVSGMTNPQKILNFLDLAAIPSGRWDPTLLAVFAGALAVMFVAFRFVPASGRPWYGTRFEIPTRADIDAPLVAGSAMFGVGWGLVGLCPGPAIAALSLAPTRHLLGATTLFVGAMLAGVWLAYVTRMSGTTREASAV